MRTYGQYCALARSLDVVGDRWTLLIIRELFARDSRYSDLREALTGIATNLLADRLRRLEAEGIVESYEAPPPVRATVYRLTERGRGLAPVLRSLVEWGMPLLDTGRGTDRFRSQWLMLALRVMYADADITDLAPLKVAIRTGDEPVVLAIGSEGLTTHLGVPRTDPDVEIEGDPESVYLLVSGTGDPGDRVSVSGTEDGIERMQTLVRRARAASPDSERVHRLGSGQSQDPGLRL